MQRLDLNTASTVYSNTGNALTLTLVQITGQSSLIPAMSSMMSTNWLMLSASLDPSVVRHTDGYLLRAARAPDAY